MSKRGYAQAQLIFFMLALQSCVGGADFTEPVVIALPTEYLPPSATPLPPSASPPPTWTTSPTPTETPFLSQTPTDTPLPPTPSGGGGLIAFQSNRSGNMDIYVMNSDGSNVRQITTSIYDDRAPSWSPDGWEIAYQSNDGGGDYEIYVVTLETRAIRQVTRNGCDDYAPVWSPDGSKFTYYSDCDGSREIWIVNADGSGAKQLTFTNQVWNVFPSWSPDGSKITFSSNRSSSKYQIYVMDADGSNEQPLAPGCVSWFSPDGNRIVYAQYCFDTGEIGLMNADGSNARTITEAPFDNNKNPSWSRDGSRIVFQSEQSGNFEIWTMETDGSNWIQLTDDPAEDAVPVWQP